MLANWLKKIGVILIEVALIAGALLFIAEKKGIQHLDQVAPALQQKFFNQQAAEIPFPTLSQPVVKKFAWEYKGVKYDLNLNLDKAVYSYYSSQPKSYAYSGELPQNWEDDYYGMFLKSNSNDQTIPNLAADLQALGKKHNLNDDQIADLVLSFVQSIEYDDAKAQNILDKTGKERMLYPYELLYQQKGVCSDKSLLAVAILRQLGYGAAIFTYEQDNHMAIGIQCPQSSSTYGSGYCYAETTAVGNKIGIIPDFDPASNKTVAIKELPTLDSSQVERQNLQQLGQVTIFQKTSGKQYVEIVQTKQIANEIDGLKKTIDVMLPQLQLQQKNISSEEKQLNDLKNQLGTYQQGQNIEKYNSMVKKYNDFIETYKNDVKNYNDKAGLYNKTIARYNVLIKQ
ncbi:MAG: transglutaminase-like domain-containing protein [Candidatus Moranbacteria bacterium]|nr:transglutaminase-like domain-containing protein [Candidatus Moranbacteria bacterium]